MGGFFLETTHKDTKKEKITKRNKGGLKRLGKNAILYI